MGDVARIVAAPRSFCAMAAKAAAASFVTASWVLVGRQESGLVQARRRRWRTSGMRRSMILMTTSSFTVLVKFVWTRISFISDTISSGGLSSASAYSLIWV